MNSKPTTRGIQEADVWAAADALIAQGLRPTIERVRQHIGRGSPNTVSPMLEGWFATLGQRLGVAEQPSGQQAENAIPQQVLDIAKNLWESARENALQVVQAQLQQREESLQAATELLDTQRLELEQRESHMQAQKQALDQALQMAQKQSEALGKRLDEVQAQVQERDQQLLQARKAMDDAAAQREQLLQKHDQDLQAASLERQRMADQYAGNERHMLTELDRARQELATSKKHATDQERKAETRFQELQAKFERSERESVELHAQIRTAQTAAALAQERTQDLKEMLQAQQQSAGSDGGSMSARKTTLAATRRSLLLLRERRGSR